jgi:uncharacterized protein
MAHQAAEKSPDHLPSWIADRLGQLVLVGSRDISTGKCVFPCIPKTSPSASRFVDVDLSQRASVYSFTIIHPNPKTGEKSFVVTYVDFPEGARAFGRLDLKTAARPEIGMTVEVCIEILPNSGARYSFVAVHEAAP